MMIKPHTITPVEDNFHKLTVAWLQADRDCGQSYTAWNEACERRKRLVALRNQAWKEVEKERAERERARRRKKRNGKRALDK